MKIAYMSCFPGGKNAYARCCSELCYRLLEKHDVTIFASYGLEQCDITWPLKGKQGERPVRIIGNPIVGQQHGDWHGDIAAAAPNYDLVIAHCDLWNQWQRVQRLRGSRWVNWIVGDHSPVPAPHRMLISSPVFVKAVPMSKWFETELKKCPQIDNSKVGHFIYHGVDPDVFQPLEAAIKLPEGCDFFIVTVAANTGHRENLPEMIEAYSIFLKETGANTYFYIHDFPQSVSGYNLYNCCQMCEELYGVQLYGKIGFKQQMNLPDSFMRDLYTRADVNLLAIQQGSFELPIIEAGACQTATITTANTPMAELVGEGERGLLVPPVAPIWANLTSSRQWIVSPHDIAKALITYYENPQLRAEHGQKMREWVLENATWDLAGQKWLDLLDELEQEIRSYGRAYFAIREGMGGAGEDHIISQRVSGKVLEVGCGLGSLLDILNRDGCQAEGVDISEYAVKVCRQKGFKAQVANAESLPYNDESFNYIVTEHLLEHCDDPMKALMESLRVAKTGVIHILPGHTGRDLTHRRYYTKEMMEEMCQSLDAFKAKFWQVDGVPDWVLEIKK